MKSIIQKINHRLGYATYRRFPRGSVAYAKKHFKGKKVICAEIGVSQGENAESMLKTLNISLIYLIDPYLERVNGEVYQGIKENHDIALKRMAKYKDKIWFVHLKSKDASKQLSKFMGGKIDFVYIDGCHKYKEVKEDMEAWFPLVKKGGIMAGHDIVEHPEVSRAVSEFCYENGIFPHYIGEDWIIIK